MCSMARAVGSGCARPLAFRWHEAVGARGAVELGIVVLGTQAAVVGVPAVATRAIAACLVAPGYIAAMPTAISLLVTLQVTIGEVPCIPFVAEIAVVIWVVLWLADAAVGARPHVAAVAVAKGIDATDILRVGFAVRLHRTDPGAVGGVIRISHATGAAIIGHVEIAGADVACRVGPLIRAVAEAARRRVAYNALGVVGAVIQHRAAPIAREVVFKSRSAASTVR
jgi:hypothetical protein